MKQRKIFFYSLLLFFSLYAIPLFADTPESVTLESGTLKSDALESAVIEGSSNNNASETKSLDVNLLKQEPSADETTTKLTTILNQRINSQAPTRAYCYDKKRCDTILVSAFYIGNKFTPVWQTNNQVTPLAVELISILKNANQEGLNLDEYHISKIDLLLEQIKHNNKSLKLQADFELTLTNAFLLYTSNLAFGKINTQRVYPGWIIKKRNFNLTSLLNKTIETQNLSFAMLAVSPKYEGYNKLREQLNKYQKIWQNGGLKKTPNGNSLKIGDKGSRVKILNNRLIATGELQESQTQNISIYSKETKKAILQFQQNNWLKVTGMVDKKTLDALNTPINELIKIISMNMDRMRYLPDNLGEHYIWVNIPDFSLNIIESGNVVSHMSIIVGKKGTKSCILDSQISYIEVNPYWNIPKTIAIKDILPKLRESPDYLQKKNIITYKNKVGSQNIVKSESIDWSKITSLNFDYIFRQQPGEQNSLGKIKFVFANDCGIYLHDTPERNLFKNQRRDYSHGCIRISKPLELAGYLLKNQTRYTLDDIESQMDSGKRKIVTLRMPEDIHVVYFTSWVDESGNLQFRPDIYKIDNPDLK